MNSLELFFNRLYQYEMIKRDNKRTGSTQVVECPIFDMSFDFTDAPPATTNMIKSDKKVNQEIEMKKEVPKKSSIRKVNLPKQVKKKPKLDNLRIDMVGYDQKPNYSIRSHSNKRRKMKE